MGNDSGRRVIALEMKSAFDAVGGFIEAHTSRVCPSCGNVCCIDRHGTHEAEDLAFIRALGESPPPEPPLADDTQPCRHLSARGCGLHRWIRPFRCTWYFCAPLLEAMPAGEMREYRRFVAGLERLVSLRREFCERTLP